MNEIKRRLGYRFGLIDAAIVDSIKPGGIFQANFSIVNDGFASPFNPRNCEIILRNKNDNSKYRLITDEDPRYWFSGDSISVNITAGIPSNIPVGQYDVFLFLPDPEPSLHDNPSYAIRLANQNVWEDSTGYNSLLHSINITNIAGGSNYSGTKFFEPYKTNGTGGGNQDKIQIDGYFNDWSKFYQLDTGVQSEDSSDAFTPSGDLVDLWATSDQNNLYFSYSLNGNYNSNYFYHIFFDTDLDTQTGFHSDSSFIGADYMIENNNLWQYTGTNGSWGWKSVGEVGFAVGLQNKNRVEISLPKSILNLSKSSFSFIFNVNENIDSVKDDYAPNNYRESAYNFDLLTSIEGLASKEQINLPKIEVYPNPFNNTIRIIFHIDKTVVKHAYIFDILGRKIKNISKNLINRSGTIWNGKNNLNYEVCSGVYFVVVETNSHVYSKKILLLK